MTKLLPSILPVPRLGAAAMLSLVVTRRMLASLVLDHYGLLGYSVRPITSDQARRRGTGGRRHHIHPVQPLRTRLLSSERQPTTQSRRSSARHGV